MNYPSVTRGMFGDGTKGLPLFRPVVSKPRNPFVCGSQNWRIYERLVEDGAITNAEIVQKMGVFNSTGRISDIRKRLEAEGWTVRSADIGGGLWKYELVQI